MRTRARGVAVVLLAMAVVSTGCWPWRSPLERAELRGAEAVTRCQDAYKSLRRAYKAGTIAKEEYDKGCKIYDEAMEVSDQLTAELDQAKAEADTKLNAPGRQQKADGYIKELNGKADQILAIIPKDKPKGTK